MSLLLLAVGGETANGQRLWVGAGGGWGFPTNNVTLESERGVPVVTPQGSGEALLSQDVDLKSGPHVYVGVGFVRSIADNFGIGVRLRAHRSTLRSTIDCRFGSECSAPDGSLRAATLEGRIILTSVDWIRPYFLVGLGLVQTSVDGVTLRDVQDSRVQAETIPFREVSIVDAGGDVGLGATIPIVGRLVLDTEVRVTGSLPGSRDNTVTVVPFTLGLAYSFN